jgi:lysozyme
MKTSTRGLLALINHEGVVLSGYRDSAGVWTIGVGHTAAAGAPKPRPGLTITLRQAIRLFRDDIRKYEAGVEQAVTVPLKSHEFDALVSFHINTGAIARAAVTRHLNAGEKKKAAAALMNWTTAGGCKGALTKRRQAERALFERGDYGNIGTVAVYDRYPGPARSVSTASLPGRPLVVSPSPTGHPSPPTRAGRYWRGILAALAIAGAAAAAFFLGAR